jgi:hypothetical protein
MHCNEESIQKFWYQRIRLKKIINDNRTVCLDTKRLNKSPTNKFPVKIERSEYHVEIETVIHHVV